LDASNIFKKTAEHSPATLRLVYSPLEREGFEPSVPVRRLQVLRRFLVASVISYSAKRTDLP
jgi:hypothetical protein